MNVMCNHNKKPRSNQSIDLGFLLLFYRWKVKKFNLTQPLVILYRDFEIWYNIGTKKLGGNTYVY